MSLGAAAWTQTPLGTLVNASRQQIKPDAIADEVPYVGLEHVSSVSGTHDWVLASEAGLKSAKFRFSQGDVLFGKLRPGLRKVAVARCAGVCSTDLVPLRPVRPHTAHLIAYQLRSEELASQISRLVAGANLPRIRVVDLLAIPFLLPPEAEIKRLCELARLLDEAQYEADRLNEKVRLLRHAAASSLMGVEGGVSHQDSSRVRSQYIRVQSSLFE
jgi:type I restriction enzyme S subunit